MANTLLANAMYTLSAEGVCGASLMAVSFALSSPGGDYARQGRYVVTLTNDATVAPLHVQPRVVFTNRMGTSTTVVHTLFLASNTQAYGGSAPQAFGIVLVPSGQTLALPIEVVAGSVLQVWLMCASNPASSVYISGAAALWRV
jgi:hypothetical protein